MIGLLVGAELLASIWTVRSCSSRPKVSLRCGCKDANCVNLLNKRARAMLLDGQLGCCHFMTGLNVGPMMAATSGPMLEHLLNHGTCCGTSDEMLVSRYALLSFCHVGRQESKTRAVSNQG